MLEKLAQARADINLKCFDIISKRIESNLIPKLRHKVLSVISDSCV